MSNTKFPPLSPGVRYVDPSGAFSTPFIIFWKLFTDNLSATLTAIEEQNATILAQNAQILAAQTAAAAAQSTANTAQSTANTANTTANAVKLTDKIDGSSTEPGTVLTGTDDGGSAKVAVAAHTRRYNDGTTRTVSADSFTGLAFSTKYYVYYDDTTLNDSTPNYQITTNGTIARNNYVVGRHFVGPVTTPADGSPPTSGGYTPPGGYTGPGDIP